MPKLPECIQSLIEKLKKFAATGMHGNIMPIPLPPPQEKLIRNLYIGILHREVDPESLQNWLGEIGNGLEIDKFVEMLLFSEERRTIDSRLFVPPGHFFSPIVDPSEVQPLFSARPSEVNISPIEIDSRAHIEMWREIVPFLKEIPFQDSPSKTTRYHFTNPSFNHGDAMLLYAMLRRFKPARIIEIGSGYSSACTLDTAEMFLDNALKCTFIEPYPRLLRSLLKREDIKRINIIPKRVQDVELSVFEELLENDILFIDSTHVLKTGSDVVFELFEVLPRIKPGVIIHFHDIFYPFEYPREWVIEENRSWNELYAIRAFLAHNNAYKILFFNSYFGQKFCEEIQDTSPLFLKNIGGSLWLQKLSNT